LEKAIEIEKAWPWFAHIWIPDLNNVQTDKKLLFSPIPYFEKTKQAVLILQGSSDEIIPGHSLGNISDALRKADNSSYETILLDGASHSMYYVGKSDFPYWSKLHPDYINAIEDWANSRPLH
jgi:pimeloyl-ACP methyl ester carboxylesterase